RSVPEKAGDYFTTNAERMRYPTFRAQGMHIGSGIAEAACKTVVATRLKRSGMRWSPDGLDALLPLRTCVLNQTYDDFWEGQPRLVA
ncbi:MAG: ISKra4 family transposase, partial [Ktedonobacteraceae bacterium]